MLYEVAFTVKALMKAGDQISPEALLVPPTPVVAADESGAIVAATILNADKLKDVEKTRLVTHVRPFLGK